MSSYTKKSDQKCVCTCRPTRPRTPEYEPSDWPTGSYAWYVDQAHGIGTVEWDSASGSWWILPNDDG